MTVDEAKPLLRKTLCEALAGNRDARNGLRLNYYPPATPRVVEFTTEDVQKSISQWENSLVDAVMGVHVSYYVMEQLIATKWRKFAQKQ